MHLDWVETTWFGGFVLTKALRLEKRFLVNIFMMQHCRNCCWLRAFIGNVIQTKYFNCTLVGIIVSLIEFAGSFTYVKVQLLEANKDQKYTINHIWNQICYLKNNYLLRLSFDINFLVALLKTYKIPIRILKNQQKSLFINNFQMN